MVLKNKQPIRVLELFAGYGGCSFALKQAKIDFETIGFSEIDKYAIQCYKQNHGDIKNYGDAQKIVAEELPDFDLLTGGFPCQSFSISGKRKGFEETKGTLFFDIVRIAKIKKPKFMLLENVKGLVNHNGGDTFKIIYRTLRELGYGVIYKVLNSKHYGIPQNRERVWLICKLGGWDFMEFTLPKKTSLKLTIKDILEKDVDSKYYLSERMIAGIKKSNYQDRKPLNIDRECKTLKVGGDTPCFKNDKCVVAGTLNVIAKKRSFETPKEINEYLKSNKGAFTIDQLATALNIPSTQVAHYFRSDASRTIPSPEIWLKLKTLLKFDDKFDKNVISVYEKLITFEQSRRIYSSDGCSPTISVAKESVIADWRYDEGLRIRKDNCSPTLTRAMGDGGGHVPLICASRGRDGTDKTEQHLEYRKDECSNTLTSVQKDNLLMVNHGWRRLTPKECFRLMGFLNDEINLDGISDTQRYKLAGNGWDINVASLILGNMFKGVKF